MSEIDYTEPGDWTDVDDGTMSSNVGDFADAVIGHKIVSVEKGEIVERPASYGWPSTGATLTLDNGSVVTLRDTDDCCAFTELEDVIYDLPNLDHVITAVTTEDGYQTWRVLADFGEVMALKVGWSSGNPFYYGYGFNIEVKEQK